MVGEDKPLEDKDVIRDLGSELRLKLNQRSNFPALRDLVLHFGCLLIMAVLINLQVPLWPLLMLIYGIVLVFLFTLFHETVHETAFASKILNTWVNRFCGFILFIPPLWFKFFHLAHHRHTQDPLMDPELATNKPGNLPQYFVHVSGLPAHWSNLRTLLDNALASKQYIYVPRSASNNIQFESRMMLTLYFFVFCFLIYVDPLLPLTLWLVPLLLGQPFLRLYLLAEHTECAAVSSMLRNTRTTLTTSLLRRLAWNMPYHAEHHLMPTVPYHRLAELHLAIKSHLAILDAGYIPFHQRLLRKLK